MPVLVGPDFTHFFSRYFLAEEKRQAVRPAAIIKVATESVFAKEFKKIHTKPNAINVTIAWPGIGDENS